MIHPPISTRKAMATRKQKEAVRISGVVVSKTYIGKGYVNVGVLSGGHKVNLMDRGNDKLRHTLVCDISEGDHVEMIQDDVYSLKVTGANVYEVDGSGPISLWLIYQENPEIRLEMLEAIARLNVGESFEDMHAATILRIK